MSNTADDHLNVADALSSQVVDVLKAVARTNDETKKKVPMTALRIHCFVLTMLSSGNAILSETSCRQGSYLRRPFEGQNFSSSVYTTSNLTPEAGEAKGGSNLIAEDACMTVIDASTTRNAEM